MKMGQLTEKLCISKETGRKKKPEYEKCIIPYEGVTVKLKSEDQQIPQTD